MKLLNSNLFGPNGLYNVTFEIVSLVPTENNLVANEIDIYAGGNTNDGGYCTQNFIIVLQKNKNY